MSKCHIVGNLMSRLKCICVVITPLTREKPQYPLFVGICDIFVSLNTHTFIRFQFITLMWFICSFTESKRSGRELWFIARKKLLCKNESSLLQFRKIVSNYVFKVNPSRFVYRGSYMSAHVLLNY